MLQNEPQNEAENTDKFLAKKNSFFAFVEVKKPEYKLFVFIVFVIVFLVLFLGFMAAISGAGSGVQILSLVIPPVAMESLKTVENVCLVSIGAFLKMASDLVTNSKSKQ